ncbi:hypothetical protein [Microcoleus sp. POL10_C6]|uniref:hypothetical protein n=1 Tax=Microcoleus sp. POL10_C6 TaxID=2818852 RepID=UPI002FCFA4B1
MIRFEAMVRNDNYQQRENTRSTPQLEVQPTNPPTNTQNAPRGHTLNTTNSCGHDCHKRNMIAAIMVGKNILPTVASPIVEPRYIPRQQAIGINYKNCISIGHLKAPMARVKFNWSMLSKLVRSATLPKPKSDV